MCEEWPAASPTTLLHQAQSLSLLVFSLGLCSDGEISPVFLPGGAHVEAEVSLLNHYLQPAHFHFNQLSGRRNVFKDSREHNAPCHSAGIRGGQGAQK